HFDIIDCQNFPYLHCFPVALVARMKKTPLVITWHEVWEDYWFEYLGIFGFFGKVIEKLVAHLSATVAAVSDMTRNNLQLLNNRPEITIIPNGIDLHRIVEVPPSDTVSDILFSGRLVREKKIDLLIQALASIKRELPDIRCIIAGDGPEMFELQKTAQYYDVSDNIRFMGFLKVHDEVIALMKSSKVFGSPSVREGFGIAALEAMACGLPVVTSDTRKNAVKDLVDERTGIITSLTPEGFAESILACIRRRDEMRNDCIKFAEGYDWDVIAGKAESYYAAIADNK
ncbi:MAG TPA: glycosyltransferase family 4 protein, partial [Methanoregulaceae archaeon]|nr:glycosyltransferase family 4 protein [Methanoregulaceae archaeon]